MALRMTSALVSTIAIALVSLNCSGEPDLDQMPYSCPADEHIICSPPTLPDSETPEFNDDICSAGAYHEWVIKRCNVTFTYTF